MTLANCLKMTSTQKIQNPEKPDQSFSKPKFKC